MYTGLIAKRYAKALLEFTCSNGQADLVYAQVKELLIFLRGNAQAKLCIASPVLSKQLKKEVISKWIEGGPCKALDSFIGLVLQHGREEFLQFMLYSFKGLYEEHFGIANVNFVTAVPMGEQVVAGVEKVILNNFKCNKVIVEQDTDEQLIGGFLLKIGDMQMDASVSSQLRKLQQALLDKL